FVEWRKVRFLGLVFSIGGAFFSFVIGGWVAARLGGINRSEPAMLHGAISWLLSIPMLLALAAVGATANFGGWYVGFGGIPGWTAAIPPADPRLAELTRNTA